MSSNPDLEHERVPFNNNATLPETGPETHRCLQRYIARDHYRLLENPPTTN